MLPLSSKPTRQMVTFHACCKINRKKCTILATLHHQSLNTLLTKYDVNVDNCRWYLWLLDLAPKTICIARLVPHLNLPCCHGKAIQWNFYDYASSRSWGLSDKIWHGSSKSAAVDVVHRNITCAIRWCFDCNGLYFCTSVQVSGGYQSCEV